MTKRHFPALWLTLFFVLLADDPLRAEDTFETLKVGSATYTNVTVLNRSASDVFIKHAGGSINFKVKDLTAEELKKLGYAPPEPAKPSVLATKMGEWSGKLKPTTTNEIVTNLSGLYVEKFKTVGISPVTALVALAAIALVFHIFYSVCMRKICVKTKAEPGGLIWIPVLQLIPLHRAAGISPALILLYLFVFPIIFVIVYRNIKLCRALGKSAWLVVLVFVPILNLFFIPYLAFSGPSEEAAAGRMKF